MNYYQCSYCGEIPLMPETHCEQCGEPIEGFIDEPIDEFIDEPFDEPFDELIDEDYYEPFDDFL